jgi:mRNA-degrading endonuclease RelE of RelBE toxin-antitoxin system
MSRSPTRAAEALPPDHPMRYDIVIARSAQDDFDRFDARWRSGLKKALEIHLRHAPKMESKSRIKRLRGLTQPQYRLRVDVFRVFYDVNDPEQRVEILGIVRKENMHQWLRQFGITE